MGRIVKAPAALLSLVMTVSAPVLIASPSAAAPPVPAATADSPPLDEVQRKLLIPSEAPEGYAFTSSYLGVEGGAPESGDPCAEASPDAPMSTERYGPMATITFQKGANGPTLSESITATGAKAARQAVARYRDILKRCPVGGDKDFPMAWAGWPLPKYGEAAVGYVLTMGSGASALRVRAAVVAYGELLVVFSKMDAKQEDGADLKKAVRTGVEKLQKAQ